MGNEASARALLHNLDDLEKALRDFEANTNDIQKNGWDPDDSSDNIEVFDSGVKIRRGGKSNQSDAVRGRSLYSNGVHFFEFNWNQNGDNKKIVSIGMATQGAGLTATGNNRVLGCDDQSVGFDMVSKKIFFNGCPVKDYPPGKPADFKVPEKIVMVLDLDNGTMGFKSDTEDFGSAMTGLRHISPDLCIAGELNKPWDELSVKYMGSSGDVRERSIRIRTPTARTLRSSTRDESGMRVPSTADEFLKGLEKTVEELKKKDPNNIQKARQMVEVYMEKAYYNIEAERLRRLAAEKLTEIDGARVITEYHNFLLTKGKHDKQMMSFLLLLRSVCWNFCDRSLILCTKFGECGFLKALIKEITGKSRTYKDDQLTKEMHNYALGILHNCAKATENKPIFRQNRYVQEAKPYTHPDYHELQVVMLSLFGMSYVAEENESKDLIMGRRVAQEVVKILSKSVVIDKGGWHAYELAVAMSNISVNPANSRNLVQAGAIPPLTKMLTAEKNYDKECALNAIWSLTNPDTMVQVSTTDGLLDRVDRLTRSDHEGVKQSAIRLKIKLQGQQQQQLKGAPVKRDCQYADLCKRFREYLDIDKSYFNDKFSTCFCPECHGARGDRSKYARGKPPKNYGIPVGWYKFGLKEPPKAAPMKVFETWHRAFHGTVKDSLKGILQVGEIVPAGRAVLGGKKIKELPGHFCDGRKPAGFDTKQLFLSPSMRYSGVDAYARPSRFQDKKSGRSYNAKVAFQVLISPGSYKVGPETIGARGEIDPDFSNQEMEWSTNQQGCHILSGLLVKLY